MRTPAHGATRAAVLLVALAACQSPPPARPYRPSPEEVEAPPEPAPPPAPTPRLQPSAQILGLPVNDEEKIQGSIGDLLIDPASGALVAVVLLPVGGEPEEVRIVRPASLAWSPATRGAQLVPPPSGSRRTLPPTRDLFDGHTPTTLQGEIKSLERIGFGQLEVRLASEDKLVHRVRVEAEPLVVRRATKLILGENVRFQAVETRDERGKLWIATSLLQGDVALTLRDAQGRLMWKDLGCLPSRSLLGRTVKTADGIDATTCDWEVDWAAGTIAELVLSIDSARYRLSWSDLVRDAQGGWRTPKLGSELEPLVTPEVAEEASEPTP